MTIISAISGGSGDAYAQLVEGLQREFNCADIASLASRIFEAEKAEFLWDARVRERYLGQHPTLYFDEDSDSGQLSRMAILSFVAGRWHAGICLVDGEGSAADLLWIRSFSLREDAEEMFVRAR